MRCSHCPVEEGACLGERTSRLCKLASTRPDYRRLLVEQARQVVKAGGRIPSLNELLGLVATCRHRGTILPHRLQVGCGCGELTHCGDGRGQISGRVTLRDCLACVSARSTAGDRCDATPPE